MMAKKRKVPVATAQAEPEALPDPKAPEVNGSPEALERHRAGALALAAEAVKTLAVDPSRAYHNAVAGRDAVLAARAAVEASGFGARWSEIETVDDLGLALIQADALVVGDGHVRGTLKPLVAEGAPLRRKLLSAARALAEHGLVPAETVKTIRAGRGTGDLGRDLIALAALFAAHERAIAGKHPIGPDQRAQAEQVGSKIVANTRTRATPRSRARVGEARAATELRDRLYTLLVARHDHLARAAGAVWGLSAAKHVPALGSNVRAKKPAAPST